MSKLRVLALMRDDLVPPESIAGMSEKDIAPWKMEYDVMAGLRKLGHEVRPVGLHDDLTVIASAIKDFQPNILFNMAVEFADRSVFAVHLISYLELLQQKFTGCNSLGYMLAHNKAISKKILAYHRIHVPEFAVFERGKRIKRPQKLAYPLLVKSLTVQGSVGISQASVVWDDEKLIERIKFIHEHTESDAIAARYIDGRELYVGILGNARLQALPVWELLFENLPEGAPKIATQKVKWDLNYQEKAGIKSQKAVDLPDGVEQRIQHMCKRVYRLLSMSGYARMDLRLTEAGEIYLLEANPNPQLSFGEDFSESSAHMGVGYEELLQRIVNLGLHYRPAWHV